MYGVWCMMHIEMRKHEKSLSRAGWLELTLCSRGEGVMGSFQQNTQHASTNHIEQQAARCNQPER